MDSRNVEELRLDGNLTVAWRRDARDHEPSCNQQLPGAMCLRLHRPESAPVLRVMFSNLRFMIPRNSIARNNPMQANF